MKIAIIAPFAIYPKGTVSVRLVPIAKQLTKRGNNVTIIIPPYDNLSHSGNHYKINDVKIDNINFKDIQIVKYLINPIIIIKKILQLKPNVIIISKPKGYSGLTAMLLYILKKSLFLRNTKLILDMDDWEGYGGFNDYFINNSRYPKFILNFLDFQEKTIPKIVNSISVASIELKNRLRKWEIPREKIFYIPNGVELKKYTQNKKNVKQLKKKCGLNGSKIILLYTRFLEYNVNYVVDILKKVKKKEKNVKLLIIGKGELNEEKKMADYAKSAGLIDSIFFAGWRHPKEISLFFSIADVAIYPFDDNSLNRAKCPGKLVELMLAGKAIVANKVGQIKEYIEDNESGILVDPGDIDQFAFKILQLLENKKIREKLGNNAQNRIIREFNWEKLTKKIIDESILNNDNKPKK